MRTAFRASSLALGDKSGYSFLAILYRPPISIHGITVVGMISAARHEHGLPRNMKTFVLHTAIDTFPAVSLPTCSEALRLEELERHIRTRKQILGELTHD